MDKIKILSINKNVVRINKHFRFIHQGLFIWFFMFSFALKAQDKELTGFLKNTSAMSERWARKII